MRLDLYEQGGYAGGGISENGGNITGPLILAGNPSQALEAVPKQYVDAYFNSINASNFTSGTLHTERLPALTGDLQTAQGGNTFTLINSGVAAGSYGKVTVNSKGIVTAGSSITDSDIPFGVSWTKVNSNSLPTTLSGYGILDAVSNTGGTLTGFLTLSQSPTANTHAATKQYVDSLVSGGGISVGDILRKPYSTTPAGFLKCNGAEVDKITYSSLYAIIGDTFNNSSNPGAGQPWKQQYQINSTQAGDITGWSTDTALPGTLGQSQAIVTKNRVYLLGGIVTSSYVSTVYTAPINDDGTIGTWATGTALPYIVGRATVVMTKNYVYLLGGRTSNNNYSAYAIIASINSDGTLGAWTSLPGFLPTGILDSQAIVTKTRVYIIGGANTANPISTVYSAPINSDGTIGAWITDNPLPDILYYSHVAVTKNRVYIMGGLNAALTSVVYTATINLDGTLSTWTTSSPLPVSVQSSQVIVTKNEIYLLGGLGATATQAVWRASINQDGTLGTWITGTSLPAAIYSAQAVITKNRLYILGGQTSASASSNTVYSAPISGGLNDYSNYYVDYSTNYINPGSGKPWQQQYQFNTTQTTDITGWSSGTSLPVALNNSQAIVTKNRVYLLGGEISGNTPISTVYTADINADGTLGAWTTGTALPVALHRSSVILTKNRVYLLGGASGGVTVNSVYTAPINADGTLGTWASGTALPSAVSRSQAIVTNSRVYLVGAYNNGYFSSVYTAPINSDGTLGTWASGTALPASIANVQLIATKNRIYVCGGRSSDGLSVSTVYSAVMASNGLLGAWTTEAPLPNYLGVSQAIVTANRVYLVGGFNGFGYQSLVYTASINADGTIGNWTTGTSLPGALAFSQAIVTKNHIYMLGGMTFGDSYSSTVYVASINSSLNDYSPYYDGSMLPSPLIQATDKFVLPDFSNDEPFGSYSYIKY